MKRVIFLILMLVLITGCSTSSSQVNPPIKSVDNQITIKDFKFTPETLNVKLGSAVTWVNEDSMNHIIKSDSFESNNLATGQSYSYTFDTAGSYEYYCSLHPSMKGNIIVE